MLHDATPTEHFTAELIEVTSEINAGVNGRIDVRPKATWIFYAEERYMKLLATATFFARVLFKSTPSAVRVREKSHLVA